MWPCILIWHHGIMIWLLRRQMRMRMQVQMQTRMQIRMQMRVQVRMQMKVRMKVQVQIRGSRMHVHNNSAPSYMHVHVCFRTGGLRSATAIRHIL